MVQAVMTSHIHCTTVENLVSHPGYVYLLSMVELKHLLTLIAVYDSALFLCIKHRCELSSKL